MCCGVCVLILSFSFVAESDRFVRVKGVVATLGLELGVGPEVDPHAAAGCLRVPRHTIRQL